MMRILLVTGFFILTHFAYAQRPHGDFNSIEIESSHKATSRNVIDTVTPVSFIPANEGGLGCFTGIYNAPDTGYVSGNNQYGDLTKAQFYSLSQMGYGRPATIQSVVVSFGLKTMSPTPESISVNVYAVDTSAFRPGAILALSNPVNLTAVKTDGSTTMFTFPAPLTLNDSFFVGLDLPIFTGDTIAIVTTYDDCVGFSNWSWEKWADGSWHSLQNSWVLDVDLAIFPVMDLPYNVGIEEFGLNEVSIFPNPAEDVVTLTYGTGSQEITEIAVYDLNGQLALHRMEPAGTGNHNLKLDVSGLSPGIYSVELKQGRSYWREKLAVVR